MCNKAVLFQSINFEKLESIIFGHKIYFEFTKILLDLTYFVEIACHAYLFKLKCLIMTICSYSLDKRSNRQILLPFKNFAIFKHRFNEGQRNCNKITFFSCKIQTFEILLPTFAHMYER